MHAFGLEAALLGAERASVVPGGELLEVVALARHGVVVAVLLVVGRVDIVS